jgi:hypothetical protein
MSPEEFARFLEHLSPDVEKAGRHYMRLHKKLAGFFYLKGVSEPGKAADETLDRAAVKICAGTPVPDVPKYCQGIARNVVREWLRRELREKSVFQSFVEGLNDDSDEEVERIERLLKPCFEQLSDDERELLLGYCQVLRGRARAEHRRQLAEAMKTTVLALRMRVTRLRGILGECVEKRSRERLAII